MPDQLSDLVRKMQTEGVPEADILAFVDQFDSVSTPVSSHEKPEARPISTGGGRGTGLDVRKSDAWAKKNAPVIGATLATTATGGGALPLILAAGAGGAVGSGLRGDDLGTMAVEGGKQAAIQGGGMAATKIIQGLSKIPYRAAIPKQILDKFGRSDLPAQGLKSRVLLGTESGAARAGAENARAGAAVGDVADTVPAMSGQDVQAAFRPKYNRALTAGKIQKANEINSHVKQSMDEIGEGFTGKQQLARKAELEPESKAAMGAVNPNMAAVNPQLANIERKAILSNLRSSKPMADALNTSQAAVGVNRAADATKNSSIFNRLGGGWLNAIKSPAVLSGAGIAMHEGGKALSPEMLRAIALMNLLGVEQE